MYEELPTLQREFQTGKIVLRKIAFEINSCDQKIKNFLYTKLAKHISIAEAWQHSYIRMLEQWRVTGSTQLTQPKIKPTSPKQSRSNAICRSWIFARNTALNITLNPRVARILQWGEVRMTSHLTIRCIQERIQKVSWGGWNFKLG